MDNWIGEVVADTVCAFITGPAGFFALHEKLRGDDAPNNEYPHSRARVAAIGRFVKQRFKNVFANAKVKRSYWSNWPIWSNRELLEAASKQGDFAPLSNRFIALISPIQRAALSVSKKYISELEYTPRRLSSDLNAYLADFLEAIPPFETKGAMLTRQPTDITSILNVGWFIAAFFLSELNIRVPEGPGQLLVHLDHLMSKAIELSEIRLEWTGKHAHDGIGRKKLA